MKDTKWRWGTCPICKEHGFMSHHECPPLWQIVPLDELSYAQDDPGYWQGVYASDARAAAEKFTERGDCSSSDFSEATFVVVRPPEEPDSMTFHQVHGELQPVYEAISLDSLADARAKYKEWFSYDPL